MSLSGLRSDNIYDSSLTVVLAGLLVGIKYPLANLGYKQRPQVSLIFKGARYSLIIHEVLVAMVFFLQGCKMRP